MNLRGNVIPALDLRKLFNLNEVERTDDTRIMIVNLDGRKTGIIVDYVSEVLKFERSFIEAPPKILSGSVNREYIQGVGKLEDGKRMILILDLEKVMSLSKLLNAENGR